MRDIPEGVVREIEKMVPASLDEVFRTNRHKGSLYLSTEKELAALKRPVHIGPVKAKISRWCFITFLQKESQTVSTMLAGYNETEQCSWMTSEVMAIDGRTILTRSGSIYALAGKPTTKPDLPHVCATLNSWGIGQHFGVPPFFF